MAKTSEGAICIALRSAVIVSLLEGSMVIESKPHREQTRELERWRRILKRYEAGLTRAEIAQLEGGIGEEQVRRLIRAAENARQKGWI